MTLDSPPFQVDPKNESLAVSRPRLLMVAYCFSPFGSMEDRNGWQRALLATRTMDVTVLYVPNIPVAELIKCLPEWVSPDALQFEPVSESLICQSLKKLDATFYLTYRLWHRKVFQRAKALHQERPFSGSHLVTLCGFREPGYVWKIDIPHIWGPLGGTHNFPKAFIHSIQSWSRLREWIRSAINRFQLNRSGRIRRAMLKSAAVVAASRGARSDFESGFGIQCDVELETGIDHPLQPIRPVRNSAQPLRILWTGRLREWKGLPILLHSIASLPDTVSVQVRIVGNGSSKTNWMNLAKKLGIADRIEWIPWPTYQETLEYYAWADVFAFTSLRDTSGTGLLEALAAGCPILGLDHQGAKDIMTSQCAIPIPVDSWHSAVSGFREGIVRLATDSHEWLRLSHGASQRAKGYLWDGRSDCIDANYRKYILGPASQTNALISNQTPTALRRSFEDDFYGSTIQKLISQGKISNSDSVLVTAGGTRDKETWQNCGFQNVTISNLDDRMVGNEFSPFQWSFQDAEKLTLEDNSVDFVCIHNGLHHCGCPQAAILEMLRVARKGILLFEPYDNLVTRIGMRFGVSQKFETAAVFYSGFTHGGLRNGPVANYVYRFTKWELEKTVSTAYPEGPIDFQFIHALRIPWEQLKGRPNKIPYYMACLSILSVSAKKGPARGASKGASSTGKVWFIQIEGFFVNPLLELDRGTSSGYGQNAGN